MIKSYFFCYQPIMTFFEKKIFFFGFGGNKFFFFNFDVKSHEYFIFGIHFDEQCWIWGFWPILVKMSHFGDPTYLQKFFHTYH